MKAIVDDYGEIGRRLAAMELERRYPLMVVDQMPAIDLRSGALNFVPSMREVEERPVTEYVSLEAIREAVRLLMFPAPYSAEND